MNLQLLVPAAAATIAALVCAASVIFLSRAKARMKFLVPVSGGLLLGIALFGLLPEIAKQLGWLRVVALTATGYLLLTVLDRFAYHVCPACSHDHDHSGCAKILHGFGGPLVTAAAIHSFVDGWGLATVNAGDSHFAGSISLAILLHKIPEGLALGTLLRAVTAGPATALALCLAAELPTMFGGAIGYWATPGAWVQYPLAMAAGTFLFLGGHAIHSAYKARSSKGESSLHV